MIWIKGDGAFDPSCSAAATGRMFQRIKEFERHSDQCGEQRNWR
jgi:hypothetical protein